MQWQCLCCKTIVCCCHYQTTRISPKLDHLVFIWCSSRSNPGRFTAIEFVLLQLQMVFRSISTEVLLLVIELFVCIPQIFDNISSHNVSSILVDHSQSEHSVSSKILLQKTVQSVLVQIRVVHFSNFQQFSYESNSRCHEVHFEYPDWQWDQSDHKTGDVPKEQEHEQFFVEHVQWQNTLSNVHVLGAQMSDIAHVAVSDSRKVVRLLNRQKNRQTDRKTDRQKDRKTERQIAKLTNKLVILS